MLPSGQVVGVIDDLPTCKELIDRIVAEADARSWRTWREAMPEPRVFNGVDSVKAAVGEHLGYSDWLEITQERVNTFAEATGDYQWIHIDVERAKAGSVRRHHRPRLPHAVAGELLPPADRRGTRASRWRSTTASTRCASSRRCSSGKRIRAGAEMMEVTDVKGGGIQTKVLITIEIEGSEKPACVIESISRWIP